MESERGQDRPWPVPPSWRTSAPRRFRAKSRIAQSPLPVPTAGDWRFRALVASLLLVIALCGLGGARPDFVIESPLPTTPVRVPPVSWERFESVRLVLVGLARALDDPHTALWRRLGVLLLALACAYSWWRWRREWLAYRPGRVDVRDFEDAVDVEDKGRGRYLKSRFCRHLADTSIYPPYAGATSLPAQDFLDVLGQDPVDLTNPSFLPRLLARCWPRTGYMICATVQQRVQEPQFGLSVTVTSFAGSTGSATTTEWGESWEDATCKAAYWAMAKILPVTRLARTAPWRAWRNRDLPAELFEAYNEAKKRHDERKLDDALWWYREALRFDPFNVDIRMSVASVQEDLGLFLAALDTYYGALGLVDLETRYTASLWATWRKQPLLRLRATAAMLRATRRQPELIRLRFQYARTLGYTERLVEDWFRTSTPGEWGVARDQLKERLTEAFTARYWPAVAGDGGVESAQRDVEARLRHRATARVLFGLAAVHEFRRLHPDAALASLAGGSRSEVTRGVLRFARDVWAPLRLARAQYDKNLDCKFAGAPPEVETVRRCQDDATGRNGATANWPVDARTLQTEIERAQRRWLPVQQLDYFDHYLAAGTYAYALYGHPPLPARQDGHRGSPERSPEARRLTRLATTELRMAVACTGNAAGGQLSAQGDARTGIAPRLRNWIASSDPDFALLRAELDFRRFQQDMYHPMRPVFRRPQNVTPIRIAAYVKRLLHDGAALLEREWHRRCRDDATTVLVDDLVDWLDLDDHSWRVLRRIAETRARYWEHRADFCRLVTRTVTFMTVADRRFPPPVPLFDELVIERARPLEDPQSRAIEEVERRVAELIGEVDSLLGRIGRVAESAIVEAQDHLTWLRQLDTEGRDLTVDQRREICTRRAAHWQAVAEIMGERTLRVEAVDHTDEQLR